MITVLLTEMSLGKDLVSTEALLFKMILHTVEGHKILQISCQDSIQRTETITSSLSPKYCADYHFFARHVSTYELIYVVC